jgi:hypothetical protein
VAAADRLRCVEALHAAAGSVRMWFEPVISVLDMELEPPRNYHVPCGATDLAISARSGQVLARFPQRSAL